MNNAVNELVRSIVKKNTLAECSVSELQRLTTQYPYFGPVQFLLARKLKEENSSQYTKQSQKAILYFQDELWFDYVTSSRLNEVVFSKNNVEAEVIPVQPLMATEETTAEVAENIETVPGSSADDIAIVEEKIIEPIIRHAEEVTAPAEEAAKVAESGEDDEEPEPIAESVEVVEQRSEPVQPAIHEKAPVEYDDGSYSSQPEIKIEGVHEQPAEPMGSEDLNNEAEETPVNTNLPPLPGLKIEPFNPETAKLSVQPYHTVDYFASLGIQSKEEEKPKDRFGQQLKNFTEWLKTLKKVPEAAPGSAPAATGPEDKKVSQMAAHSLDEKEVVTEATADVWQKHGNHEKAIDTY